MLTPEQVKELNKLHAEYHRIQKTHGYPKDPANSTMTGKEFSYMQKLKQEMLVILTDY